MTLTGIAMNDDCSEDVIKSIWLRLRHQPQLLDNFELLLRRLTTELQRSHVDYYALQKTSRTYAVNYITSTSLTLSYWPV